MHLKTFKVKPDYGKMLILQINVKMDKHWPTGGQPVFQVIFLLNFVTKGLHKV